MRTTESAPHLDSIIATGPLPAHVDLFFLAQEKYHPAHCTPLSDSAQQSLAQETALVNSQLQAQYQLHPKFLQSS
ncbi:MAG: hypothetical protein WGN25_08775 [Candidatus Electrothrix sp. GW3-4]|uniref:hypothetical protein n=1 Tax=Candidatus Electrothrix sp. GW3-4 TaxID=3126740 RepID=UPI0030D48145